MSSTLADLNTSSTRMDLRDMIEAVDISFISHSESTILDEEEFVSRRDILHTNYIVSFVMTRLLILIEFKDNIDLQSITLYALSRTSRTDIELSAPKTVHICHIDTLDLTLDDIKKVKPTQSVDCAPNQLNKGQTIHLKAFEGIKYVAIYIASNHGTGGRYYHTYLNGIAFTGHYNTKPSENDENKPTSDDLKQEDAPRHVPCICGIELTEMMANDEYFKPNKVACSQCGQYQQGAVKVYHCTNESNNWHLKGYNLCEQCANFEIILKQTYPNQYGPQQGVPLQYTGRGLALSAGQNVSAFEPPSGQKKHVPCICGSELSETTAQNAYSHTDQVDCSRCYACLKGTTTVFHCANGSNNWHANGCDLCQGCADWAVGVPQMYFQQYRAAQTGMGMTPSQHMPIHSVHQQTSDGKSVWCICGSVLSETTAQNAYSNQTANVVNCDRCGARLEGTTAVFHCKSGSNYCHPNGFDLCVGCTDEVFNMQQQVDTQSVPMQPQIMVQANQMNMQNTQFEFDKSDTSTKKHLSEMLQSDDSDPNVNANRFGSESIFESNIIRSTSQSCKLSTCDSLKRLHIVLDKYHLYINTLQQNLIDTLYDDNKYSNTALLNDFNHLLLSHANEFEDIHVILTQTDHGKPLCTLSKCVMIKRNRRNRSKDDKDLYFGQDERNTNKQQLLDKIHSYYIHSFDAGYKLTRDDRERIMHDDVKMNNNDDDTLIDVRVRWFDEVIRRRTTEYEHVEELHENATLMNKYTLDTDVMEYSYGFRYFYWKWYANNLDINDYAHPAGGSADIDLQRPPNGAGVRLKEWYITPKYKSFKDELINNAICVISLSKWQMLEIKANDHFKTDFVRQFKCPRTVSAACYDMKYGQKMSIDHLISLMTYCNFGELAKAFTATFRRNKNETNMALKKRHRHFYYLGRLLRECCECFGMANRWLTNDGYRNEIMKVYHGINNHFVFDSITAFIKGPTSTTTDYAVAVKFGGVKGMIVQLSVEVPNWVLKFNEGEEAKTRLSCFDMQWISDFPNESEIFFIGGLNHFTFDTIIEARSGPGVNYKMYIKGLTQMTYNMSCGDVVETNTEAPLSMAEKAIVYRLLSHEIFRCSPEAEGGNEFKKCPDYIKAIVRRHCANIESIMFSSKLEQDITDTAEHCKLHDALFKYDNEWIKLDLIMKVFPNTNMILYQCVPKEEDVEFLKRAFIYNSVLDFIKNNPRTKLVSISIDMGLDLLHVSADVNTQMCQNIIFHIHHFMPAFNRFCWQIDAGIINTSAVTASFKIHMMNLNVY